MPNATLPLPSLKHQPELDPGFQPASIWRQTFRGLCEERGSRELKLVILRPDGTGLDHSEQILAGDDTESAALNFRLIERTVKFLLWSFGGTSVVLENAPELASELQEHYREGGAREFDVDYSRRFYGETLTISSVEPGQLPTPKAEEESSSEIGLKGNRIGFDLGGSDRKCAAVVDGQVVFSDEVTWDPYFQSDPAYHLEGILDSIRLAAGHLPSVDAIGGSAAGVYVDSKVRAASLFRGVPDELFADHVENIFFEVAKEWGVPIRVVNDGDVTALAGAMSLKDGCVLGLAMGTSAAAGYADENSRITSRLSELAFVPVDFNDEAARDEWSGDIGCAVNYFSQQAVSRLIEPAGLDIDPSLDKPEKLVLVQKSMEEGDDRAAAIYRTIGCYLGYAIPQFARFYEIRHLLLLGRVLTGKGGEIIIAKAEEVLRDEFPDLAARISLSTPDEKMKRHGQAIAAASLPTI
ncbi:MAG: ROK family protein [Akkermansiaceae bacterium]|jgi:predicted NBD/HSP70 family sugar kinase